MVKKILLALITLAVITASAACGGSGGTGASVETSKAGTEGFAKYLAGNTPLFISMNPQLEGQQATNWSKITSAFKSIPGISKSLEESSPISATTSVDFDKDIKPWVGNEVALAATSLAGLVSGAESKDTSKATGDFLAGAQVKDQTKFDAFIAKVKDEQTKAGATFTDETYKDVKITTVKSKDGQISAYGVVNGYAVLAGKVESLKAFIDQGQPKDSLSTNANFKTAVGKLSSDRIGFGYMDYQAAIQSSASALPDSQKKLLEKSQPLVAIAFSWQATANGLKVDYVGSLDQAKLDATTKALAGLPANPNKAAGLAPDSSIVYIGGQNLKLIWDALKAADTGTTGGQSLTDGLTQIQTGLGVDLEKDVFGWMTGEFALAVLPGKSGGSAGSMLPVEGALIVEAKDKTLAQGNMKKITDTLASQGLTFAEQDVKGVKVQSAQGMESLGLSVSYAFVGDFMVVASSSDVMSAVIDASQGKGKLSDKASFKDLLSNLPKENGYLFYTDIPGTIDLALGALGSLGGQSGTTDEAKTALKPLKSAGASGTVKSDFITGSFFVTIEGQTS